METYDKITMAIIIVLLLSSLTFGLAYFYIYGLYKQNTDMLKQTCNVTNSVIDITYSQNDLIKKCYNVTLPSLTKLNCSKLTK
jgi:hypothetical protein